MSGAVQLQPEVVAEFVADGPSYIKAVRQFSRVRYVSRLSRGWRLLLAFGMGIGLGLVIHFLWPSVDPVFYNGVIVGVAGAFVLLGLVTSWLSAASMKRVAQFVAGRHYTVSSNSRGLVFSSIDGDIIMPYERIDGVLRVSDGVMFSAGVLAHYVPYSAFPSAEKRGEFLALLRDKLLPEVAAKLEP